LTTFSFAGLIVDGANVEDDPLRRSRRHLKCGQITLPSTPPTMVAVRPPNRHPPPRSRQNRQSKSPTYNYIGHIPKGRRTSSSDKDHESSEFDLSNPRDGEPSSAGGFRCKKTTPADLLPRGRAANYMLLTASALIQPAARHETPSGKLSCSITKISIRSHGMFFLSTG